LKIKTKLGFEADSPFKEHEKFSHLQSEKCSHVLGRARIKTAVSQLRAMAIASFSLPLPDGSSNSNHPSLTEDESKQGKVNLLCSQLRIILGCYFFPEGNNFLS